MYTWHAVNVGRICVGLRGNRVDVLAPGDFDAANNSKREALCAVQDL